MRWSRSIACLGRLVCDTITFCLAPYIPTDESDGFTALSINAVSDANIQIPPFLFSHLEGKPPPKRGLFGWQDRQHQEQLKELREVYSAVHNIAVDINVALHAHDRPGHI